MNYLVKGSLQEISTQLNMGLAETFLNVEAIVLVDMSGSMSANDAPGYSSRYDAAEQELSKLQKEYPGKIAVISFSDFPVFSPNGIPQRFGGSTNMSAALEFVKMADDTEIQFILVSDGQPNSPEDTLRVARSFKSKINTIYIGPEGGSGKYFLEKLASLTGGTFFKSKQVGLLAEPMRLLLGA